MTTLEDECVISGRGIVGEHATEHLDSAIEASNIAFASDPKPAEKDLYGAERRQWR